MNIKIAYIRYIYCQTRQFSKDKKQASNFLTKKDEFRKLDQSSVLPDLFSSLFDHL